MVIIGLTFLIAIMQMRLPQNHKKEKTSKSQKQLLTHLCSGDHFIGIWDYKILKGKFCEDLLTSYGFVVFFSRVNKDCTNVGRMCGLV
jgi:hypothetical protein